MNRERTARWVTVFVLAGAFALVIWRRQSPAPDSSPIANPAAEASPQDAVYGMLDAARAGNVSTYLESFAGEQAETVSRSLRETTPDNFSAYLRSTHASIKGIALMEPRPVNDREVKVRVEYVFADRNEAQEMILIKTSRTWKIASITAAERVPTTVPYGTPVQ